MNKTDTIQLVRNHASSKPSPNFSAPINHTPNREYSIGKDKDGLDKEHRQQIEAIKDRMTYPDEDFKGDLW